MSDTDATDPERPKHSVFLSYASADREAARLIKAGSVACDGETWRQLAPPAAGAGGVVVKVGKHRFARLVPKRPTITE